MSLKFKDIKCGDLIEIPSTMNPLTSLKIIVLTNVGQGRYVVYRLNNNVTYGMCIYEKYDTNLCV